jgi:hypothetical protein
LRATSRGGEFAAEIEGRDDVARRGARGLADSRGRLADSQRHLGAGEAEAAKGAPTARVALLDALFEAAWTAAGAGDREGARVVREAASRLLEGSDEAAGTVAPHQEDRGTSKR